MKKMNNKGFSLIELIIVIAIMAVLVAIIAPNLTKYLGKSKKNTDKKNADEIASQIQTCISDFETSDSGGTAYGYVFDTTKTSVTLTWAATGGVTVANSTNNAVFKKILDDAITSSTASKEVTSGTVGSSGATPYAFGEIKLRSGSTDPGDGYQITVWLGKASVQK